MPVRAGRDNKGTFYRWGGRGAKYYYSNKVAKKAAYKKALTQGQAAYASGYKK